MIYEGGVKDNQYHGKGKVTYPDGISGIGIWEDGEFKGWEKRLD